MADDVQPAVELQCRVNDPKEDNVGKNMGQEDGLNRSSCPHFLANAFTRRISRDARREQVRWVAGLWRGNDRARRGNTRFRQNSLLHRCGKSWKRATWAPDANCDS